MLGGFDELALGQPPQCDRLLELDADERRQQRGAQIFAAGAAQAARQAVDDEAQPGGQLRVRAGHAPARRRAFGAPPRRGTLRLGVILGGLPRVSMAKVYHTNYSC